jgi:hypothetical protein
VVVGYQNLVVVPSLRKAAEEPRLAPLVSLHAATRGGSAVMLNATQKMGAGLAIEVPEEPAYPSYTFELYDAQSKLEWSQTVAAPADGSGRNGLYSLSIPGAGLKPGSGQLLIYGVAANGQRMEIERQLFDVHFID